MKTVFITGANRGLGLEFSRQYLAAGNRVIATARNPEDSEGLQALKKEYGEHLSLYPLDVTDANSRAAVSDAVGDRVIHLLINNAGITKDTLMLRMGEEQWDQVIEVNLKSVFNLTKHVLRPMLKNRGGSIINMSSVVGVFGNAGQANYAASKAGIIGFTKSIAKEVGSRGIRCNAIAPGFIETDMTDYLKDGGAEQWFSKIPLQRFGKPGEVADVALFLASDMSSYVSGQVLNVCGAMDT